MFYLNLRLRALAHGFMGIANEKETIMTAQNAFAPIATIHIPSTQADVVAEAPRTHLRLTRRGRIVFGSLGTAAVIAAFAIVALFTSSQAVASAENGGADFGYVIVQPGASLWQLAEEIDPEKDPRDLVSEIVRLNQLDSSELQAGQAIAVPLRYSEAPGVVSASELGL